MPIRRANTNNQEGDADEENREEGEHGKGKAEKQHQEDDEEYHEDEVNHRTTCNGCRKAIYCLRHKCWGCSNFNYCSECIKKASKNHPGHRFETLYEAKSRKPRSSKPLRVGVDDRGGRGYGRPDRRSVRPVPGPKAKGFLGFLGLREPAEPAPYDRPTHRGNNYGKGGPKRGMPPGPPPPVIRSGIRRPDSDREFHEAMRAGVQRQRPQGPFDPGRAGRRDVRRGPDRQHMGGRRNDQRGPTAEEAEDQEEGEGRVDAERDGDQDLDDPAEQYERQTQKILIPPHEPLSANAPNSEPPPEAPDPPSRADVLGRIPQARRRAGVHANVWTARGRGGGQAGRVGRDRGDAYRGND